MVTSAGAPAMQAPFFVLADHQPVRAVNAVNWLRWMQRTDRRLRQDHLPNGLRVSTVFLGYDPDRGRTAPPHLFETAVLQGTAPVAVQRYATWEAAEAGHRQLVRRMQRYRVKGGPAIGRK